MALALVLGCTALNGCAPTPDGKLNRVQRMMLEPAREAERRGDDVAAFRAYLSAANDGMVYAQYTVARFYQDGRGTQQNYTQA
ncbi:MAG: hypothetical protein ACREH3_06045, partial [Geminicoccales bacterium]